MSTILHALGTPRRREILRLVWRREMSAGDIHRSFADVTFGAVSQHLRQLETAGLVRARRDGRSRVYAARREALGPLAAWLEGMWDDALYSLKLRAEMEHARRGPRTTGAARPGREHRAGPARSVPNRTRSPKPARTRSHRRHR